MKKTMIAAALAAAVLAACSPPFSRELLDGVDRGASYAEVQKDPDRFRGKTLLLGGMIVETRNLKDGTRIEILQRPLDRESRPLPTDASVGRFLLFTTEFLDPAVYRGGRSISAIAEVRGSETLPLGETTYRYPALTARDLHLWAPSTGPRFSFGIGVYRGY